MSEAERKALFAMLRGVDYLALVFHIWARGDAEKDGAWQQFANDPSNTSTPSRLAFSLEGFFRNDFDAELLEESDIIYFLNNFKYYPNSNKKERFRELLRVKVEEHHATVLALLRKSSTLRCLVNVFIGQQDRMGLTALNRLVSAEILDAAAELDGLESGSYTVIVRTCQRLHGRVDDGCIDSLSLLAERIGAAEVLRSLDYSIIRANNMGEILRTLGISREHMDAALANLSHNNKPEDELAAVLREFDKFSRDRSLDTLFTPHSLWFYLWKKHQEAFIKYVHPNIQQHYLPKEPSLLERFRQLVCTLWP